VKASTSLGHNCGPLAAFEEGIGLHALHELIAAHYGFVIEGTWKNRASINDSACGRAVDVDDNGRETLFANILIAKLICTPLPSKVNPVHARDKSRQTHKEKRSCLSDVHFLWENIRSDVTLCIEEGTIEDGQGLHMAVGATCI